MRSGSRDPCWISAQLPALVFLCFNSALVLGENERVLILHLCFCAEGVLIGACCIQCLLVL
jgi:hypothetical protein